MEVSAATLWWVVAGVLVVAELTTGTFYLLMIAGGLVAGALAAHLGASAAVQVTAAALVGGGATAVWHWSRSKLPRPAPASQNKDVNLDVGEQVTVQAWTADGTARVAYRGTEWRALLAPGAAPHAGACRITAVEGNSLVLTPLDRAAS